MGKRATIGLLLFLGACQPSVREAETSAGSSDQADVAVNAPPATNVAIQAPPPATEPPVDETSAEAAAQIVERYGDFLEQRRFAQARGLWGDNAPDESGLISEFDRYATIQSTVGAPGRLDRSNSASSFRA